MTDNNIIDKPQKLTFNSSRLTLNRPANSSLIGTRINTVTVEVKKGIVHSNLSSNRKIEEISEASESLTNEELNKKLTLLKRAAELAKTQEQEAENVRTSAQAEFQAGGTQEGIISTPTVEETVSQEKKGLDNNLTLTQSNLKAMREATPAALSSYTVNKSVATATQVKASDPKSEDNLDNNTNLIVSHNEDGDNKKRSPEVKVTAKLKKEEPKKLRKTEILNMLDADEEVSNKTRSLASIRRAREKERRKSLNLKSTDKIYREVIIPEAISVSELAARMSERAADVIRELMKLGMIVTANQTIDADTAELIVTTMGHTGKRIQESDIESMLLISDSAIEDLAPRPPVVTVMGHVDHGKTSLLDALKATDVAAGEVGGITQHIGAYSVKLSSGQSITFLDTPGHEAFTAIRSRGAKVTDIVILVVAADDGIMTQTIEAINHAKAANVPIIVAINKIDKPDANIEKVKNELLMHELIAEDLGGDTIIVPISAIKKQNLDKLEEAILLVAEMAELKANYKANASGAVIEAKIDKGKGVIATVLVQRGILKVGDLVVAGESYGRVKRMINNHGTDIYECLPSMPAEILGLNQAPMAGDTFAVVRTEKQARDITEYRSRLSNSTRILQTQRRHSVEDFFGKTAGENRVKELTIIIKGDVQGSIEAISSSLNKIISDEVKIRIIHTGVGGITDSDVMLASATHALVLGFNVRAANTVTLAAERAGVDMRYYSIIYNLLDDVKAMMSGMLSPIIREEYIGSVDIRQVFNITKIGKVAGSYVTKGIIKRGAGVRLLRDNIVIYEGKLKTLKRFTEDVKEVKENYECGIAFENYDDIRIGDRVEVFEVVQEQKKL